MIGERAPRLLADDAVNDLAQGRFEARSGWSGPRGFPARGASRCAAAVSCASGASLAGGGLQSGSAFVLRADIARSPNANPLSGYFSASQLF